MKVPKEYYDEIFQYKDQWGLPSACGLKIRHYEGKTYIIVTELYQENPGNSITYAGRTLAEQICEAKGYQLEDVVYIECAPDTNSKLSFYAEEYFVVDFNADLQHKYSKLDPVMVKNMLTQ